MGVIAGIEFGLEATGESGHRENEEQAQPGHGLRIH
jgi:hypothetical protein